MSNLTQQHAAKFLVAGSLIAGSLFGLQGNAEAASLHFKTLGSGVELRSGLLEGTCGAGKSDTTKSKDHKCAAKKDSKSKGKGKDGKCGQGKCGGN
ncbi:hypothetical protein [Dinghuibacter silviterrae]|uniref:Low-complexity protein n=1 Tax=Dinghuibacter silviterrae TaxID=1539049 RepID=A0A4R8DPH4_9BACT|nr:hypothetical protein [Dinghuibacter silviterrae]TDW99607.1 hypothetical protein EDB95_0617 [Dinghuibacter silviterrae]